jgi:hypothetical protein
MSRERAEMRVRSGNEHTRTYTHAAILLIHNCHLSPPFFPYLGVGERPTFLRQHPLLSSVSPLFGSWDNTSLLLSSAAGDSSK